MTVCNLEFYLFFKEIVLKLISHIDTLSTLYQLQKKDKSMDLFFVLKLFSVCLFFKEELFSLRMLIQFNVYI